MRTVLASFKMFLVIAVALFFSQVVTCQSSQKSGSVDRPDAKDSSSASHKKVQDLMEKLQSSRMGSGKLDPHLPKLSGESEGRGLKRKAKSLTLYPYYLPQVMPYALPPGYFHPQNKDFDSAYANEWLSRTEPFKRNTALLDSPTYYIRLPPNPYAFVPGLGYVSRPPALSEPEVYETNKPEPPNVSAGNDLFHDPFYRLPINFVSNGKPTSVYQLANDQAPAKPEPNFINLNKGPYVFNGKPSEIFLVAQIYNALYGDELSHFYP